MAEKQLQLLTVIAVPFLYTICKTIQEVKMKQSLYQKQQSIRNQSFQEQINVIAKNQQLIQSYLKLTSKAGMNLPEWDEKQHGTQWKDPLERGN